MILSKTAKFKEKKCVTFMCFQKNCLITWISGQTVVTMSPDRDESYLSKLDKR